MMEKSPCCHICLRVDRNTCVLGQALGDFLQSLRGSANRDPNAEYCLECAHQLRKFHRFKEKCVEAGTILNSWRKTEIVVNNIHIDVMDSESLEIEASGTVTKITQIKHEMSLDNADFVDVSNNVPNSSNKGSDNERNEDELDDKNDLNGSFNIATPKSEVKLEKDLTTEHFHFDGEVSIFSEESIVKHGYDCAGNDDEYESNKNDMSFLSDIVPNERNSLLGDKNYSLNISTPGTEMKSENIYVDNEDSMIYFQCDEDSMSSDKPIVKNENDYADDDYEDELNDLMFLSDDAELDDMNENKRKQCPITFEDRHSDTNFSDDNDDYLIPVGKAKRLKQTNLPSSATNIDSGDKNESKQPTELFSENNLKENLRKIFEKCNVVTGHDGTIIERDVILQSVDKWPNQMLKTMWNYTISDSEKFSPNALKILVYYQNNFGGKFGNIFEIEHLKSTERVMEEFLKRKTHESYTGLPFKCELCYQGFKKEVSLAKHQKKYHDPSAGDIECKMCRMRMTTASSLSEHKKRHRIVFRCKLCSYVSKYRNGMVKHVQKHMASQHQCDKCHETFMSEEDLAVHVHDSHIEKFICVFCAKIFTSADGYEMHRQMNHKYAVMPEEGVPCDKCHINFFSVDTFEKHLRLTHGGRFKAKSKVYIDGRAGLRPFACDACPARFHMSETLSKHRLHHRPPPQFRCEQCAMQLPTGASLYSHMKNHGEVLPYKCSWCAMVYKHSTSLRRHTKRHHAAELAAAASSRTKQEEPNKANEETAEMLSLYNDGSLRTYSASRTAEPAAAASSRPKQEEPNKPNEETAEMLSLYNGSLRTYSANFRRHPKTSIEKPMDESTA